MKTKANSTNIAIFNQPLFSQDQFTQSPFDSSGDSTTPYVESLYLSGDFDGTKYPSLGSVDMNLNAVEGACVTPNGTDNKAEFTHADVANIDNIKAYILDSTWQEVTTDTDLYSISGTTLTLFYDSSWYAKPIAYFKAYNATGTLLFHFPFAEAKGDTIYDVVTGTSATIVGTFSDSTTRGDTQDDVFYNLEYGFDLWQNDSDDEYIHIPVQSDGTSILTDGDTLTGYTWVSKHLQTGDKILPFEGRFQFDKRQILYDVDGELSYLYSLTDGDMAKLDYNELFESFASNNLVVNGRFADGTYSTTATYASHSVANNVLSNTGDGTNSAPIIDFVIPVTVGANHKYYVRVCFKITNTSNTIVQWIISGTTGGTGVLAYNQKPTENALTYVSSIITASADVTGNLRFYGRHFYADSATADNKVMEIDGNYGVEVYDLTAIYGAGNEPSTITDKDLNYIRWNNITCNVADTYKDKMKILSSRALYKSGLFDEISFANALNTNDIKLNAIEGACLIANGTNNYVDTGIAPVDSEDWYWEVYGKFNTTGDDQHLGVRTVYLNGHFYFGIASSNWYLGYKTTTYQGSACDTDYHTFKVYGNGKLFVDGIEDIDLSATSGSISLLDIFLFSRNDAGSADNFANFTCIYSKIVSNGTTLQHLVFSQNSGDKVYDVITGAEYQIEGTVSDSTTWGV